MSTKRERYEYLKRSRHFVNEIEKNAPDDCFIDLARFPEPGKEDLKRMCSWRDIHPSWYKTTKRRISFLVDKDILEPLSSSQYDFDTRANQILRAFIEAHPDEFSR